MSDKTAGRMAGKATSLEIAHLAGVSQPTVSRALRDSPVVSSATRERIRAIAAQLQYSVDRNASSLRTRQTRTLALLIFEDPTPDHSFINPFFHSMLGSITRACAARRYDLLVSFQPRVPDEHGDREVARKVDGIILLGYGDYHDYRPRLDALLESGVHFVRWGQAQEGQPGHAVCCDNFQGGRDATHHLLECGRRRIAFIGHASSHYPEFFERYRGHVAALAGAGMAPDPRLQIDAISTEEAGHRAALALLAGGRNFEGVLAASDLIALGAMRALRERGVAVPRRVSIVGFDDIAAASFANPALTTVLQDTRLAGEILVDTLLTLVRGERAADRVLPARLIVRGSSEPGAQGAAD
jgi:DNA-binding LacI/PurR family transcriptional regulator